MIIGTGVDIVENNRIKALIQKYEDHFLEKVYTKAEIDYCQNKKEAAVSFAARFAAKEAVLKALGTGMRNNSWQEIEILNNKLGKPEIILFGKTKKRAAELKISNIFLSMAHEKKYSIAQVIMEGVK